MKLIAIILCALSLTGCATAEYQAYADAHKAQAAALYLAPHRQQVLSVGRTHTVLD